MKSEVKKMTEAAMFLALGILLPIAFHQFGLGSIYEPMLLPVILCGFVTGPVYGALIGLLTPLLSSAFTGMPPLAVLPSMTVELVAMGFFTGLFFYLIKSKWLSLDIYLTLIPALLIGRILGGITNIIVYAIGVGQGTKAAYYTWLAFWTSYFVTPWPGIVLQLVVIPLVLVALSKAHLLSNSDRWLAYQKEEKKNAASQITFFNNLAPHWDEENQLSEEQIETILHDVVIKPNDQILDVACGTGILEPALSKRGAYVTGLDIAPKMIGIAESKNHDPHVSYKIIDFYHYFSDRLYDTIIVFNAYPHFIDKEAFREKAVSLLKKGGHLYLIHSSSKEDIDRCHLGEKTKPVSSHLRSARREAAVFWTAFKKGKLIDSNNRYFVELIKR